MIREYEIRYTCNGTLNSIVTTDYSIICKIRDLLEEYNVQYSVFNRPA